MAEDAVLAGLAIHATLAQAFSSVFEQYPELIPTIGIDYQKRRYFDRYGKWPGLAERHGVNAVIDLLVEQHILNDEDSLRAWLHKYASNSSGKYRAPDRYAPCPCGSQKAMKFCHEEALKPVFERLSRTTNPVFLADALETK